MRPIVQKFGGSSLATPQLRSIAAQRVVEARGRGLAPVVVCSALGRAPEPYATDTLGAMLPATSPGPNRDLMLASGELIAAALFAGVLESHGTPAQAMSGAHAGIVTDDTFGDARIVRVETTSLLGVLDRGIVPVVAGFQGATEAGAFTTLGRGGSDLTAIALGAALAAEAVEIYTDVSGVMSGDPKRVDGARVVERVQYAEMVELSRDGAKVVHAKAAELARANRTPYVVKGLQSGTGTVVDDRGAAAAAHAVSGVTAIRDMAFFRVIPGDIDDAESRRALHVTLFRRLAERAISVDMINVNHAGVFFIAVGARTDAIKAEVAGLNVAVRVRPHCAKLSIVGAGMRGTPGVMYRIVDALTQQAIDVIHSTDSSITISVLVAEEQAARAEQALHDAFGLEKETPPRDAQQKEAIA